ncbi:NUDIX hydrolase [Microbacterium soli]|uniref:Nudix hydrolase domain-containing protein n=1 Tax=Microbacterium soli TaxID=446075 RepID=A0ABP7MNA0_9MICO
MGTDTPIRVAGTAVVLRDAGAGPETLLLRRPMTGSFPGAWVFPGGSVDPADRDGEPAEAVAAQRAAVRETREEAGIGIRDLTLLSRWIPPAEAPARFRTWFFLARDRGDEVRVNPGEITDAVWLTAARALAEHASGALVLAPPTWVTLHGLLAHRTVDEALTSVREPALFATHVRTTDGGRIVMWAGDEEHPDRPGPAGARHRLLMGDPPWTYQRT